MSHYSDLETRMREYEEVTNYTLTRRMPVIIRCDIRSGLSSLYARLHPPI